MIPTRRRVLELTGAIATGTVVGSAGCTSVDAQETELDDLPEYSRWLTLTDGRLEFAFVDWATIGEDVEEELEEADPDEEIPAEFEDDPMIAPVSEGLTSTYFFVGLTLAQFRLGRLLDEDAFESTVEGLLRVDGTFVATGTIDTGEIAEQLTAEPEAGFIRQMERTDAIGEYDIYTSVESDPEAAIGVGADAVVVVDSEETDADDPDPLTALETTVEVSEGDAEGTADESESFAWLLETAGIGDVAVGQYGGPFDPEELVHPALDGFEDAEGFVSSLTVEDEETAIGEFAAIVDDPDEAVPVDALGASADERSVDVDDDRVTATATWRDDEVTTG